MTETLSTRPLAGKVALVTGAARGIGFGSAQALAEQGAMVALLDRDQNALDQATVQFEALGHASIALTGDVASNDDVKRAIDTIVARQGRLDYIVNSAAIQPYGTVETMAEADWDRVMTINLKSIYLTGRYGIPHLRAQGGGAIVNIASVQGLACQTNVAAYVASKGAVLALTRAMALDHARDNIRVNAVCPGSIDTPLLRFAAHENKGSGTEDEMITQWGRAHPLGRVGTTAEVGSMVAFLCGPGASFCTGGEYKVDGGLLAKLGAALPE